MKKNIGWHFPESGGGAYDGFNEAGIETFSGERFRSLAREILQNSLDAATTEKVTVEFEVIPIPRSKFPGLSELGKSISRCSKEPSVKADSKANAAIFFKHAKEIVEAPKISCLRIRDSGTTGLRGPVNGPTGQWFAITKGRGLSEGKDPVAGGSFGIGKSAPFTVSDLRTIFYSTRYEENGKPVERALGKCILTSQTMKPGIYTSGTGYYGISEKGIPLEGADIPEELRVIGHGDGTQILIGGFSGRGGIENWQNQIIAEVVANFFYAIHSGKLEVMIQGKSGQLDVIDKQMLRGWFDNPRISSNKAVRDAKFYYEACTGDLHEHGIQVPTLGHWRMWAYVDDGLPGKVALLRATGMLITDAQKGLIRWPGFSDFAAVCICQGNDGNALLRRMENPQHNAFEPERLGNKRECQKAEKALDTLTKKIREKLKQIAMPETSGPTALDELSEYFPDQDPDETLPGEGNERNLEGAPIYSPKPIKFKAGSPATIDEDGEEGGAGSEAGGGTGGGGSGGSQGTRGRIAPMKIENVRVLHEASDGRKKTVKFTPSESGNAKILLRIAGDDSAAEKLRIAEVQAGGQMAGNSTIAVRARAGNRATVKVLLEDPIADAIVVVASRE